MWAITSVFAHVLFYDGLPLKNSSKYQRVFAHYNPDKIIFSTKAHSWTVNASSKLKTF